MGTAQNIYLEHKIIKKTTKYKKYSLHIILKNSNKERKNSNGCCSRIIMNPS